MRRRLVIGALLVAIVAGLFVAGRRLVERVPVIVRRGATLEVRRQPLLAFERLLDASDLDAFTIEVSVETLREFGSAGVVLMLDEGAIDLSRALEDELLQWVERGGTLVLSPIGNDAGAISARVGARLRSVDAVAAARGRQRDSIEVSLPGQATRYRLSPPARGFLLDDTPSWSAGDGQGGYAVAAVPHGRGRVVLVAGLSDLWRNERIGYLDHAAFLWALASLAESRMVLLTDTAVPEVSWGRVAAHGWPALTAGALLGVLALWRVLPRMGPVLTPPPTERRQLREHLEALGRFHVRHGDFAHLTASAQRAVQHRLARVPWQRHQADDALLATQASTPAQFLQTIQRLHAAWRRLHRA